MSLSLNLGTAFETAVNKSLAPWKATALQTVQNDGSLLKLSDVLSPLDKQTSIKISNTKINNVYQSVARGSIPIGNQSTNTTGQQIFVELVATASKTVGDTEILLPIVSRIDVKLPNDGDLTNADVLTLIMATLAGMCDDTGAFHVTDMMRGVLHPNAS